MLKSIPASSEFWIGAYHGLRHLVPYPVSYALRDPYQYGPGVQEGVLGKILNGMVTESLDEVASVQAISAFSSYCSEKEWTSWYRPILEKRLRIPMTITEFNKACPKEYRITDNPRLATLDSVAQVGGMPAQFILEPYNDAQRLLVLLRGKETYVFLADGTPVHRLLPGVFDRFRNNEGVAVEVYEDEGKYFARDILLWDQFFDEVACPPVDRRLKILEDMLAGQDVMEVIEHWYHDEGTVPREDIALIYDAGYPGVVIRPINHGYWQEHASIVVHPKRKSVLTCTKIIEGSPEGKYAGRAESIWGKGRMNKKSFESPVFHGLTFTDRERILKARDEFIGKKFDVLSCGLDSSGSLIFPIIKQWKE